MDIEKGSLKSITETSIIYTVCFVVWGGGIAFMHAKPYQSMKSLKSFLETIDGKNYGSYGTLRRKSFEDAGHVLRFEHIQGSPGASPASVCSIHLKKTDLGLQKQFISNRYRKIAAKDYILRAFNNGVNEHTRRNRGSQGSGSFQPPELPPQVLERNIIVFDRDHIRLHFRVSLPGSADNRVLGRQAVDMFLLELPQVIESVSASLKTRTERLKAHCHRVEDMLTLQAQLEAYHLAAFIADGSILPRASGISEAPLKEGAIPFWSPEEEAVVLDLPNRKKVRGLGIRKGVTVLIGGGFHGKSTLVEALARGVYPHIPDDGRECVVTDASATFICTEDGRSVSGVDISGFISNLPGDVDTRRFITGNASGSTSEAAAIVEAVLSGSRLLLIDEDSSATNFLIRDSNMRHLIPEDPIIPLFDRVRELYEKHGVSTLIVSGGSSDYVGAADHVIAMRDYLPVSMTGQTRTMNFPAPVKPSAPLIIEDRRQLLPDNFTPSYQAKRIGKTIPVRIKPLRLYEKILEYGNSRLDLTSLKTLVDADQVLAVGYALLLARNRFSHDHLSPTQLASRIDTCIENENLDVLDAPWLFLARPRLQDLAGAINRIRGLDIRIVLAEPVEPD